MNFLIISGMSGAGKSRVSITMEDLGYYCVDNLPADIIPPFAQFCLATNGEYDKVAMVTDVRSGLTPEGFARALRQLDVLGCEYSTLFVDASTEEIIKRYKETRRVHPFREEHHSTLEQAVEAEREHLAAIRAMADEVVDTSSLGINKLRGELIGRYGGTRPGTMSVNVMSFGFKYGLPMDADLVFDVRLLPNPYYVDSLRTKTGEEREVYDYVFSFEETHEYLKRLQNWLDFALPGFAESGRTGLSICVGCTGGHHRSVAIARALGKYIAEKGFVTVVYHRDISRE